MAGPTEQSIKWVAKFQDDFSAPLARLKQDAIQAWEEVSRTFVTGAADIREAEEAITGFRVHGAGLPPGGALPPGAAFPAGAPDPISGLLSLIVDVLASGFDRLLKVLEVFGKGLESARDAILGLEIPRDLLTKGALEGMVRGILARAGRAPDVLREILQGALVGLEQETVQQTKQTGVSLERLVDAIESLPAEERARLTEIIGGAPGVAGVGRPEAAVVTPEGGGILGRIVTGFGGAISKVFGTSLTALGGAAASAVTSAFAAIGPIAMVAKAVGDILQPIVSMASELFDALLEPFVVLGEILSTALVPVFEALSAILYPIAEILEPIISALTDILTAVFELFIPGLTLLGALLRPIGLIFQILLAPLRIISTLMSSFTDVIMDLLDVFLEPLEEMMYQLEDAIERVIESFEEMGIDVIRDIMVPMITAATVVMILFTKTLVVFMNVASEMIKALSFGAIDLGKFGMPGMGGAERRLFPEIGAPIEIEPYTMEEAELGPGVIFKQEGKDEIAVAIREQTDVLLANGFDKEIKAIAATTLDPDDWMVSDPILAKVASFSGGVA